MQQYVVQQGDTIFSIALRFGLTPQQVLAANPQVVDPNLILPGQVLNIPTAVQPTPPTGATQYVVRPGDTMSMIARRFGVTLQALVAANPQIANPNILFPGQIVYVPARPVEPVPPTGTKFHIVKSGETLTAIATMYNTTVAKLLELNPTITNPDVIQIGQRIVVPAV